MTPVWNIVAWTVWAAAGLALEFLGVSNPHYMTITYVLRTYVPRWILAMVYGWLGWHFLIAPHDTRRD